MKLLTIIMMPLVLFGTGALACAANQQTAFDQANTAFAQKNYGRAASDFRGIIARRGYSAPVLFNLANAYYKDGQIGLAILNYERANFSRQATPTSPSIYTLSAPMRVLLIVQRCGSTRQRVSSA